MLLRKKMHKINIIKEFFADKGCFYDEGRLDGLFLWVELKKIKISHKKSQKLERFKLPGRLILHNSVTLVIHNVF